MNPTSNDRSRWSGMFLISAAILALEVLHMRILSVQMWHHHAYTIVTMAMLGFAVSGTITTVFPALLRGNVAARLSWCSTLFGVCTLGAHLLVPAAADAATAMSAGTSATSLVLAYTILLVPYFFGGMVITLALSAAGKVHGLYFVNLIGSALGAWLFILLIRPLGGERLLVLCAALGPATALLFAGPRRARVASVTALLALGGCAFLFAQPDLLQTEVGAGKRRFVEGDTIERRWTPLSRLDIVENPASDTVKHIVQDGVGGTYMYSDAGWPGRGPLEAHAVAYVPYLLKKVQAGARGTVPPLDVLIIGIGGGSDLRAAVEYGADSVLGVEINEEMTRITGRDYADFNGGIYQLPGVEVQVGEGRSTLRRLDRKFDLIQLAGVDTYTAGASGAFVLSESYLYTMEALADYFDHLNTGGTLGIVRFYDNPPRETLRIFGMALLALRARGIEQPSRHAVVLKNSWTSGTVFALEPFEDAEIDFYARADEPPPDGTPSAVNTLFLPGRTATNHPAYQALADAVDAGTEAEFYKSYGVDITPVTDDSPFFFNFHHIWNLVDFEDSEFGRQNDLEFPVAPSILRRLLLQITILVLALVLLPLLLLRRSGLRGGSHSVRHLAYFTGIGAGFMLLEISMVQRLVLFLGHPTYALTVVLFCFLFFAGLGSLASGRLVVNQARGIRRAVILLGAIALIYLATFGPILSSLLQLELPSRILVAIGLLAPLNFLMGMPFPLALSRLKDAAPQLVPWAIGANGGASVIGSVLAVIIAMETGFTMVGVVAVLAYAGGMLAATTGPLKA